MTRTNVKRPILLILTLFALSGVAAAQDFRIPSVDKKRAGKWDVTFNINYVPSQDYGDTVDSFTNLSISSRTGWGVGLDYNMTDHFALGFDFSWVNPRYDATILTFDQDGSNPQLVDVSNRADIVSTQLGLTWNMLKSRFTPFVKATGGWTFVDSNISDGIVNCYWDPWWGPVCFSSTRSESGFSYGGGAGLRWEAGRSLLFKLSYNILYFESSGSSSKPELESIKFEIGGRY